MEGSITREIARNPECPQLSDAAVTLLTELCFGKNIDIVSFNRPTVPETMFVFGTTSHAYRTAAHVSSLIRYGRQTGRFTICRVIISGGLPQDGTAQSERILERIGQNSFPDVQFSCEREATNTRENVAFSVRQGFLDESTPSILMVAINAHCGRAALTLQAQLPRTVIVQHGYAVSFPRVSEVLFSDTWHRVPEFRASVWSEFLRIEKYGSRGDIAYPEHVAQKVRLIRNTQA